MSPNRKGSVNFAGETDQRITQSTAHLKASPTGKGALTRTTSFYLASFPKFNKTGMQGSNSVQKISDSNSLQTMQINRMMENFEKDARSNAQQVRDLLVVEKNRKDMFKKIEDKQKREKVISLAYL
jgi:hypothetical protein